MTAGDVRPRSGDHEPHPKAAVGVSERDQRRAEQREQLARLLDASASDLELREKRDLARDEAVRALRDLAKEANAAGATKLGFEAQEADRALSRDAREACAAGVMKNVNAAAAGRTPAAREPLGERLSIVRRHVTRTCELAAL